MAASGSVLKKQPSTSVPKRKQKVGAVRFRGIDVAKHGVRHRGDGYTVMIQTTSITVFLSVHASASSAILSRHCRLWITTPCTRLSPTITVESFRL